MYGETKHVRMFEAENAYPCTVLADEAAVKCKLDAPVCVQSPASLHIIELMLLHGPNMCRCTRLSHADRLVVLHPSYIFCVAMIDSAAPEPNLEHSSTNCAKSIDGASRSSLFMKLLS